MTTEQELEALHEIGWTLSEEWIMEHVIYNRGFHFLCNDIFDWGCADSERITVEDLPAISAACEEAADNGDDTLAWGPLLWIARKRGRRPQGAAYALMPESLWPLFNAAGPQREIGPGNPYSVGRNRPGHGGDHSDTAEGASAK